MENLLRQFDALLRRQSRFIGRKVERLQHVTRITGSTPELHDNLIIWSDLNATNAPQQIQQQIEYYAAIEHPFQWIVYHHDQPANLQQLLTSAGFRTDASEVVVVAPAADIAAIETPGACEIQRLTSPGELEPLLQVQDAVWGGQYQDFVVRWLGTLLRDHLDQCCIVVARKDGQPAGAAWCTLFPHSPFAPLFGGSVVSEFRGQGIYRAMVAARAKAALATGHSHCVVDAGPESLPILLRNGFQEITQRTEMVMDHN